MSIPILALEKDLFFAVKIRDTLHHHDMLVTTVRSLAAFEQQLAETSPALAIVNNATVGIDWEAAIRSARSQNVPVLVFGSHMDLEARQKALQAGAQKVVANSKFSRDMPALVQRVMQSPAGTTAAQDDEDEE